jgi:predicted alpha/beta-hydrolase family hydrolase
VTASQIDVGGGTVTALRYDAGGERRGIQLVLAHGAGADQRHPFMVAFAEGLAARGIDVVTFNFLYTEQGRKAPDRAPVLTSTWRRVIEVVRDERALVIGGKSMGGRIASMVAAEGVEGLRALVFLGYPLHPPKRPEQLRAAHLAKVRLPMLFVQGARDAFGTPEELAPILAPLEPAAEVYAVADGDHSLAVPKRAGIAQSEVFAAAQSKIAAWLIALR